MTLLIAHQIDSTRAFACTFPQAPDSKHNAKAYMCATALLEGLLP